MVHQGTRELLKELSFLLALFCTLLSSNKNTLALLQLKILESFPSNKEVTQFHSKEVELPLFWEDKVQSSRWQVIFFSGHFKKSASQQE